MLRFFVKTSRYLLLFAGIAFAARAQEQKSLLQQDTSMKSLRSLGLELLLSKPAFLFPASPELRPENFPAYFRQSLTAPLPTFPWELQENIDLQSIWQQELVKQNKYRTLKTILGSVQVGTAAYLTYLHLKKYGFK
jgi:hypothetical protein